MYALTHDPKAFVLGIVVAQIDPLSVAAVLSSSHLSSRVKAILGAWASFDGPITVLLIVYGTPLLANFTGLDSAFTEVIPGDWANQFFFNLLLAAGAFVCWRVVRSSQALSIVLLGVLAIISTSRFLMLGVAFSGLFPSPIDRTIRQTLQCA